MKNQWDDFDCALASSLSELPPPDEAVRGVTPFRSAVSHIVVGLCFTCFTLHFWYLQYLLPAVGTLQIYLGFRVLKCNNYWFRFAWYTSICKAILLYISYILDATPLSQDIPLGRAGAALFIGTTLLLFLSFHFGLTQAAREVGQTPRGRPALWAAVWYGILTLLAFLTPDIGWLGFIPLLIAFVCIVRSLLRVSEELEDWGYSVRASAVKISSGRLSALYLGSLLVLILLCAAWSNHLSMDAEPVSEIAAPEISVIQARLAELGFPQELLSRLPKEEIEQLSAASRCVVENDQGGLGSEKGREAFGFETVYVETAPRTFRVYEFFRLNKGALRSNWRVLAQLDADTHGAVSDISCGVTWTKGGISYRGYPPIAGQVHEDFFFGPSTLPSTVFSYPFFSQDRGGYVAYNTVLEDDWIYFCSILRTYLTTYRSFYPYTGLLTDSLQTDWSAQSYSLCKIQEN